MNKTKSKSNPVSKALATLLAFALALSLVPFGALQAYADPINELIANLSKIEEFFDRVNDPSAKK